ncbi:MAG: hypothetical protein LBJ58_05530 [Tannerellaceae bacterium]|nr:hypothetical protein [Tannerellaceae bacterium]
MEKFSPPSLVGRLSLKIYPLKRSSGGFRGKILPSFARREAFAGKFFALSPVGRLSREKSPLLFFSPLRESIDGVSAVGAAFALTIKPPCAARSHLCRRVKKGNGSIGKTAATPTAETPSTLSRRGKNSPPISPVGGLSRGDAAPELR